MNPSMQAALQRAGYSIEPLFDARDVEALAQLHRETSPSVPSDFYVTAFSSDIEYRRRTFDGIRAIAEEKLRRLLPGYRLLMACFVTKRAKSTSGYLGLHQDYTYVDPAKHVAINLWAPLRDVDHRNACLQVIDGSHRFGHICATVPNPSPFDPLRPQLDFDWKVECPMKAGDAFVFDARLLHATDENVTDEDRTAVLMNLVPEGEEPIAYFWNEQAPRQLDVYKIDSEVLLRLPPNQYLPNAEELGAKFLRTIPYDPPALDIEKASELAGRTAKAAPLGRGRRPALRDPKLDEQLHRLGYVVVPLLSPEDIQQLRRHRAETVGELPADYYPASWNPELEQRRRIRDGIDAVIQRRVLPMLNGYRCGNSSFIDKRAKTSKGKMPAHQDFTMVDQSACVGVHIWLPLVDVEESNACLIVYPGTHLLADYVSSVPPRPTPYSNVFDELERDCGVPLKMKAGEVVFFDERMMHGSGQNNSDRERPAISAVYVPEGSKMRLYEPVEAGSDSLRVLEFDELHDVFLHNLKLQIVNPEAVAVTGTIRNPVRKLTSADLDPIRKLALELRDDNTIDTPAIPVRDQPRKQSWIRRWFQ